ncbi:hypothetical protein QFC21_001582 [Naganishia friedmannii]|uniref:Uncharacterized protein n=1 Tax=Naganishia friedmannii TaxID=89922 RepID=A0ACC2W6E2_9TREE|nr:hypothetical protein QFC21_001582 [Naganishia friedmannii]
MAYHYYPTTEQWYMKSVPLPVLEGLDLMYHPGLRLFKCTVCQVFLQPRSAAQHSYWTHSYAMSGPTKTALEAHFVNPGWTKPHPPIEIGVPLPPIDNLPIVSAFQCTLQECGFITPSESAIKSHFTTRHKCPHDEEYVLAINATKLVVGNPPVWISVTGEPGSTGRDDDTIRSSHDPSVRSSPEPADQARADTIDGISTDLMRADDADRSPPSSPAIQTRRSQRRATQKPGYVKSDNEDSVESEPDNDREDVSWTLALAPAPPPVVPPATYALRGQQRTSTETPPTAKPARARRRRIPVPPTVVTTSNPAPSHGKASRPSSSASKPPNDSARPVPSRAVTISPCEPTSAAELIVQSSSSSSSLKRRRVKSPG